MDIIFTKHAEEKLQERKISRELVISCVNASDYVVDSKHGSKIMHKLINDKLLRVVCSFQSDDCIVITQYYTKPQRYQLEDE